MTALAASGVVASASHAQVTVATRDSQLLATGISAMLPVDVARLRALRPAVLADDVVAGTGAERAYGSRGVPGDVPPDATLIMRFQLLDVSEGTLPNPDECVRS